MYGCPRRITDQAKEHCLSTGILESLWLLMEYGHHDIDTSSCILNFHEIPNISPESYIQIKDRKKVRSITMITVSFITTIHEKRASHTNKRFAPTNRQNTRDAHDLNVDFIFKS